MLFLPNSFLPAQYPSASAGPSFLLYLLSNIPNVSLSRSITFGLLVIFLVIPVVPCGRSLHLVILPVIPVVPCGSSLHLVILPVIPIVPCGSSLHLVIIPVIPVVPWSGITLDLLVILSVIPVIPGCGSSLRLLSDLNDFVTSTF